MAAFLNNSNALRLASCLALVAINGAGCGESATEGDAGGADTAVVDSQASDADTGGIDTATGQDTNKPADTEPQDSGTIDPDSIGPSCPSEAGCPCSEAKECDSGFCIETPDGNQCAKDCVDGCPAAYKCATTTGAGGDVKNICVPQWGDLCNPCQANADCITVGHADAACLPRGDGGSFCGVACVDDASCPEGYGCQDTKDTGGNAVKQCVVKNNGACGCSAAAIKAELSTTCYVTAGTAKCAGKRTCLPDGAKNAPPGGGLSACLAPEPEPEKCDGLDNDCDGQSDESTCDDGNPCTIDTCAGGDGCKTTNAVSDCDADDSVCSVQDTCKDGKCVAGKALDCNDNNPCTADKCDPKKGCQYEALSGPICNADDNDCTQSDACQDGSCVAGKKKSCESGDACTPGVCKPTTGKCDYKFQIGAPCDDGNPCTAGETCKDDSCKGDAAKCDDNEPCTADTCETAKGGCVHSPTSGPCTDGNPCTKLDGCKGGTCVGLAMSATDCDDNNACTKDVCLPATGCQNTPESGTPCEDGNTCTQSDICAQGKCQGGSNICDCKLDADCGKQEDGNLCNGTLYCDTSASPFKCKVKDSTIIACDTSINSTCQTNGCNPQDGKCKLTFASQGAPCDKDGSVCTQNDACNGSGLCLAGAVATCDDKNPCTDDSCDAKLGCVYKPNTAPCNADDNACTGNDSCKDGTCLPGDNKKCNDDEPCTIDSCNKTTGACEYAETGKDCDDDNACTKDDACGKDSNGKYTCQPGKPISCDDGNACTSDSCDKVKACQISNVVDGFACNDGNACTDFDACASGKCGGQAIDVAKKCDDSNDCTADVCDSKTGCDHKPLSGKTCNDADDCTVSDTCSNGKCLAGTNICACQADSDCQDDNNPCNGKPFCDKAQAPYICKTNPATVIKCDAGQDNFCATNTCQPADGKCLLVTKQDNTPCDADGSVCSVGDACMAGKCEPGKSLQCDDLNPCTADSCDAKLGCQHLNQLGSCNADDDACTANDACTEGKCVAGKKVDCNDNEQCTSELCDKKTGKCSYTELTGSCDDAKTCTDGDGCGKNASGSWTCLPGKAKACDDGNPCTNDTCAEPQGGTPGGCKYAIEDGKKVACYTGPKGTGGVGICKDGTQSCDAQGKLGVCLNDVTPEAKEACDAKDNNCDGVTDEGCAPTGFVARDGNASVRATGSNFGVNARVGDPAAGMAAAGTGGKFSARTGFFGWLMALLGK